MLASRADGPFGGPYTLQGRRVNLTQDIFAEILTLAG